jgi:hypothetical protein
LWYDEQEESGGGGGRWVGTGRRKELGGDGVYIVGDRLGPLTPLDWMDVVCFVVDVMRVDGFDLMGT